MHITAIYGVCSLDTYPFALFEMFNSRESVISLQFIQVDAANLVFFKKKGKKKKREKQV